MNKTFRKTVLAALMALAFGNAHAVLERAGPINNDPSVGGFPAWYQDTTGLAVEFCNPLTQSEVDGGWCLLLPGDVVIPEVFPTNFFDEHFYFAATALAPVADGSRALLVLAQEAAFAVGPAIPGDQIVFARIRVRLDNVPVTGTYRVIHPYGEEVIQGVAGDRIFFTEDLGINCGVGQFDCALNSRLGPFLLPSATPGGAEMPALTAQNPTPDTDPAHFGGAFAPTTYPGTGRAYVADPARIGPVTGSTLPNFVDSTGATRNHNVFRIEGPPGSNLGVDPVTGASVDWIETTDFNLMGRVFTGTLPGKVTLERANYTLDATGTAVDVYASAVPTAPTRLPSQPRSDSIAPQLSFYDSACGTVTDAQGNVTGYTAPAGGTATQLVAAGKDQWARSTPAAVPASVCLEDNSARDANGQIVPVYSQAPAKDEVRIARAEYDPATQSLTVEASSSDLVQAPTLTATGFGDLVNGQLVVSPLLAPPARVRVSSSKLGAATLDVVTKVSAAPPSTAPVAANDTFTVNEDSGANTLAVLANDANVTGGTVSLATLPKLGSAAVNGDGTVTYTPNLNANGTDSFTYKVTVGTTVSNVGTATINLAPVNDAPVAVNDGAATAINTPININVLANDTDVDGQADLANAVIVSQPQAGASVTGGAGGVVNFSATATGTYTFTYQAQDRAGALSAPATVTVDVATGEQVNITTALYRTQQRRWVVNGASSIAGGEFVTVMLTSGIPAAPCSAEGQIIGTDQVDASGAFVVDVRPGFDPSTTTCTRVKALSDLGGVSPAVTFTIRR